MTSGKGSWRRPSRISEEELRQRFEDAFGGELTIQNVANLTDKAEMRGRPVIDSTPDTVRGGPGEKFTICGWFYCPCGESHAVSIVALEEGHRVYCCGCRRAWSPPEGGWESYYD